MVHAHPRRAAATQNGVKANSLSVEAWVAAANDLLVSENIRGVQIPALCRKLKVTKGSFYWHFSGREDLLRALLDSWRRRMTLNIYSKLGRISTGATSTLRALLALPRKRFSAAGAAIEMSIRDWGRREKFAHEALREVDAIRLRSFEQSFQSLGFSPREARIRGYIAYVIMMGDSILKETLADQVATDEFVELAVQLLAPAAEPPGYERPQVGEASGQR
jgi:AcrR family transcriptional regulator